MIISVNGLKKFVPNLPDIEELATLIGARLVEIESIENLSDKYKDVIIAKVISAEKVKNSDHLNLCKIDDGGVREGVERDENGYIQVVCGAPNMREGLFVAWLPPESIVPETYRTEDEFKLSARKLMGNMSNGMIASMQELGLGDEHDGILEISPDVFAGNLNAGDSFAEKFDLNDYLLEVENKSLTHRPDCFGSIGFAREVAGILGQKFNNIEEFETQDFNFIIDDDKEKISVKIEDSDICDRYQAIVLNIEDVKKSTPFSPTDTYILKSGMKLNDTIVNDSNMLMLLTAQPMHTFDYDKLKDLNNGNQVEMVVRKAFKNEELELLDGRTIKMSENDIVIATGEDGSVAVALAGAMGGKSTEIDENTKNILVESATFNLYNLRNTQMRHGIFSEAITRFTKGQPAELTAPALYVFDRLMRQKGAKNISQIAESWPIKNNPQINWTEFSRINDVLGKDFSQEEVVNTLQNVGFKTEIVEDGIRTIAPFWRTDIHISEDIIEEIGRLNGYDNIDLKLPSRTFKAVEKSNLDLFKSEIRNILIASGANEILSYSFVHGDLLEKVGQDLKNSYRITNSISPDLQYYRQTLTPSVLSKVNQNIRSGYDEFAIFEINKITEKSLGLNSENVPNEQNKLAFVYSAKKGENAFYQAKYFAEYLFEKIGISVSFSNFDTEKVPLYNEFEPKRSAVISLTGHDKKVIGVVGEYRNSVKKALKLPDSTSGFEINIDLLVENYKQKNHKVKKFSKFQSVERDISLKVNGMKSFAEVFNNFENISDNFENIEIQVSPIDIFQNGDGTKNISLRFKIIPFDKTLNGEEIHDIVKKIEDKARKIGAEIV